jgi:hypothetical protein
MDPGPAAAVAIGLAMIYIGLLGGAAAAFFALRSHEPPSEGEAHATHDEPEPASVRRAA